MSSSGTTNLADLPTLSGESDPVQLHAKETNFKVENAAAQLQESREKDTTEINAIVSGIQTASAAGALQLPQRDVPRNEDHLVQDQQTKPNYIPASGSDYIGEGQTNEDIMRQHVAKQRANTNSDDMLDILQVPIIIALLYFAFQMPVLRKLTYEKLPFLFAKDGNPTTLGSAIVSLAFAGSYVGLTRTLDYLSI